MSDWVWQEGNWKDLVNSGVLSLIKDVELTKIAAPWSYNVHNHLNYNRLFWDIFKNGIKTPLLVRPWNVPFKAKGARFGCKIDGNRLDNAPSPTYNKTPEYELVLGNMRYCAIYTQGYKSVDCLMLPHDQWNIVVEDLWSIYHPVFEGNYYNHPDYKMPSKYNQGFG